MSIRSLFAALLLAPPVLYGQGDDANHFSTPEEELQASLVADQTAVVPGQKFSVALKLEHKEQWHSFWKNGGAYSQATKIVWTLPEGFTAGEIIWPTPSAHILEGFDGEMQHVYEGTALLVTEMTAPANLKTGTRVKLTGHMDMQTCKDICLTPKFDLTLEMDVAEKAEPVAAVASGIEAVRKSQPVSNPAWKTSVAKDGEGWIVKAEPGPGAVADPGTVYFFDATAATAAMTQKWTKEGNALVLKLSINEAAKPAGQTPKGFIHSDKSWVEGSEVKNILVGEPEKEAAPTRSMPAKTTQETPPAPAAETAAIPTDDDALVAEIRSWGIKDLGGSGEAKSNDLTWPLAILFALLGGMILNLMPCVFPVLGIKILGFVKQAHEDAGAVKKHGLVYAAGVIASLMALAGVLLALRAGSENLGWGFQLQNPWFLLALILVVFGFSLSMAGVFEFGTKLTGVGGELQSESGYRGSFFSGLLTVLLATPCTGPLMGPALGFALNKDTPYLLVVVIFLALSIGLALPYVVLSWFPALVKKLPRPGAWMETFKQFMSFPMFATAAWLVTVFAGTTGESGVAYILFGLTVFAMMLWLYGRFFQKPAKPRSKKIAGLVALLCLGSAGWLSAQAAMQKAETSGTLNARTIVERRKKGQITVVDLWAKWCLQCESNRKFAFDKEAFQKELPKYDAVFMVGDKTVSGSSSDILTDKFLKAYQQGGIPYAFIVPAKGPVIVLPTVIGSPDTLIEGLKEAQAQGKK